MFKILVYGSVVSAALFAATVSGQARQISVWGNNFVTDDGPVAIPVAPAAPRFNATVEHPERLMRHHRRLDTLN